MPWYETKRAPNWQGVQWQCGCVVAVESENFTGRRQRCDFTKARVHLANHHANYVPKCHTIPCAMPRTLKGKLQ